MSSSRTKTLAAIAGGALVTAGIVGATIAQAAPGTIADSGMMTGTTTTVTTAPGTPPVPMAEPSIKAPAPLPVEEQGLPG